MASKLTNKRVAGRFVWRPDRLDNLEEAIDFARTVRGVHARTSAVESPQRLKDIGEAKAMLTRAMLPCRSYLGRARFMEDTPEHRRTVERIRELTAQAKKERITLWRLRVGYRPKKSMGPR